MNVQDFTICVEARVAESNTIIGMDECKSFFVKEILISVKLEQSILILTASGFENKDAAKSFHPKLMYALHNLALSFDFVFSILPKKIAVYQTGELSFVIRGNEVNLPIGRSWDRVKSALVLGINAKASTDGSEPSLLLALDLYTSSLGQAAKSAKLITLISSLEVLSVRDKRPEKIVRLIEELFANLEKEKTNAESLGDNSLAAALEEALLDTSWKKQISIGKSVRNLVTPHIAKTLSEKKEELEKRINKAYRIRSKFLHEGGKGVQPEELDQAYTTAKDVAIAVLRAKLSL